MKLEWEQGYSGDYMATEPIFETIYRVKVVKPFGPYEASGRIMDAVETDTLEDGFAAAQADFDARLAKCIPPGWKLVPEEATDAMIDAANAYAERNWKPEILEAVQLAMRVGYRAMLSAAPEPGEG